MRRKAAKQTMAVEPESLPCSLAGLERHVGQGADTRGRQPAARRTLPARRGPGRERREGRRAAGIPAKAARQAGRESERERESKGEKEKERRDKRRTTVFSQRTGPECQRVRGA